jgi:hypothetical protein
LQNSGWPGWRGVRQRRPSEKANVHNDVERVSDMRVSLELDLGLNGHGCEIRERRLENVENGFPFLKKRAQRTLR